MAIKSSIRSPSSISSNPNPNSRNGQENMDNVRRSFTSNGSKLSKPCSVSQPRIINPITNPANTPAEYSRRRSHGKDGVRDYEQKENEQDTNSQPPRLRSPSIVKGSKKFMSTTISAASKINASPRKKVLGERNEAVRTSASYSAGKFHFYSSETESFAVHDHENELKLKPENSPQTNTTLVSSMTATEFQNKCTDNLIEEPAINLTDADDAKNKPEPEPDVVVLSLLKSFKCNEAASLDKDSVTTGVDSRLPPYDPKNNYLSPRPRFLHYKPKPRVQPYVDRGMQFEDELVSENSNETEDSHEETTPSKDSGGETPESLQFSEYFESSQISESCNSLLVKENVESEVATKHKSSYFTFSKALVFILLVSIAFPLAIHAPSITATWNHDQVVYKFLHESHKVADLAREHMESWCDNLKSKLVQSFGYLSSITDGFRKAEKLGTLKYINVTDLPDYDGRNYEFEKFKMDTFGVEKASDEVIDDKMEIPGYDGSDYEFEQVVMDTSIKQNANVKPVCEEMGIPGNTEESMYVDYPKVENDLESEDHVDFLDEIQATQPHLKVNELQENSESSAPTADDIAVENLFENSEAVATEQQQYLTDTDREESGQTAQENTDTFPGISDEPQSVIEDEEHLSTFSTGPDLERSTSLAFSGWKAKLMEVAHSLKQLLADNKVAISVISMAALLLATIFVCLKLRKRSPQQQAGKSKPLAKTISACSIKPQTSYSQNGPLEEMEGYSCPSEKSSSRRENQVADEVHSSERSSVRRTQKHESLVSTSSEHKMGSPSYGSFTTYSIVHNKNGDEEVVTPLRRSSRIRNKVTYS